MTFDLLEREVLNLPTSERFQLAERLTASLPIDPSIEAAWAGEIERRIRSVEDGSAKMLPMDEVMGRLRAQFQ
jgi:putative addiction module component (TIGR02574 family)